VNYLLPFNTAPLSSKYRNRDLQSRWNWVVCFVLQSFSFKDSLQSERMKTRPLRRPWLLQIQQTPEKQQA